MRLLLRILFFFLYTVSIFLISGGIYFGLYYFSIGDGANMFASFGVFILGILMGYNAYMNLKDKQEKSSLLNFLTFMLTYFFF